MTTRVQSSSGNETHAGLEKLKILVVGAAVDAETMEILKRVDKAPQIQTYRFHWAFMNGIEAAIGSKLDIISTVPTRDFPFTRKLFWKLKRAQRGNGEGRQFVIMPFVNLLGFKQITRFLSCLWFSLSWLWRHRKEPRKMLLLYGIIVSHLYSSLLLARLFGCKVVAIVTDPPTQRQDDEGLIYAPARAIDRRLLLWSLRQLNGLIVLTEPTSRLLGPDVPAIVVESIISNEVARFSIELNRAADDGEPDAKFVVMYAGQMNERTAGLEALLDAFHQIEDPDMALWLFGKGSLVPEVQRSAQKDPRITYWGFVEDRTLFLRMRQASLMVIPRPPDDRVTPFCFPSKLLEYLAMGKITISAKLAGIPADYYPYLVLVDEISADALAARLREVSGWSLETRCRMEAQVREFAWANKTQSRQGQRVLAFLNTIV